MLYTHTHTHAHTDHLDKWESCYRSQRSSKLHTPQLHFPPWRFQPDEKVSCLSEWFPQTGKSKGQKHIFSGIIYACDKYTHICHCCACRVPDESFWPAPEWNNHLCWYALFPRGQACPHTQCADVLVDTRTIEGTKKTRIHAYKKKERKVAIGS